MTKPIRVMTVDDHPLIREGLAALLADHPDISIVGEASDGDEATVKFDELLPDIVLLDLQMPRMSGLEALEVIKGKHPSSRFIILTTYNTEQLASKALNAGAQAYLLKSSVRHELVDTIHAVFRGQRRIAADIAESLAAHADDDALSRRELSVLELIAGGNSNKAVGERLSITEETVKGHVKSILVKLTAKDRTHAVALAIKRGIIEI